MVRTLAPKGLTPTRFNATNMAGKQHRHGCLQCRLSYSCDCQTPEVDDLCNSCISGRISAYQEAIEPRECCRRKCKRATDADRTKYKLAGPGPWFLCTTCRRQHPTNPGGSQ